MDMGKEKNLTIPLADLWRITYFMVN